MSALSISRISFFAKLWRRYGDGLHELTPAPTQHVLQAFACRSYSFDHVPLKVERVVDRCVRGEVALR